MDRDLLVTIVKTRRRKKQDIRSKHGGLKQPNGVTEREEMS
mgnify:CR=1 FL=1